MGLDFYFEYIMRVLYFYLFLFFSSISMVSQGEERIDCDIDIFKRYLDNAVSGDYHSQFVVGEYYTQGCAVDKDLIEANVWYLLSANQGNPYSANQLGIYYDVYAESDDDFNKSVNWYKKAVELGFNGALVNLGLLYFVEGKNKDYLKSYEYFLKASKSNEFESMYHLGLAHKMGFGVELDLNKSLYWFKRSAAIGNPHGMRELGLIYQKGGIVPRDYQLAEQLFLQGRNLNDLNSIHSLATFYFAVEGELSSVEKGVFYMREAAFLGHRLAQHKMGIFFDKGIGVMKDIKLSKLFKMHE